MMAPLTSTAIWLVWGLIIWYIVQIIEKRRAYHKAMIANGCSSPRKYPHKDPFLGLDMFIGFAKAMQNGKLLPKVESYFVECGKTFQSNAWGRTIINTMDPRVIKTVLTQESENFGVAPYRSEAIEPLMKDGIFTADGEDWARSRGMAKQIFSGVRNSTIPSLEKHVDRLLQLIPRDGSAVDLQPLLKRMFLDKSTEFLFGVSQNSLLSGPSDPDSEDFISAFDRALNGLHARIFLGKFAFLRGRDTKWKSDLALVHAFIDKYVDMAIERKRLREKNLTKTATYIYLDELLKTTTDRMELRNQMLNIFLPARDSISSAVSFVFFHLARYPQVWDKLHHEVDGIGDATITFDLLKSMKYLRFVINESLRLLAPAGLSLRTCLEDCVLPCGGGANGGDPILVQKGTEIRIVFHALHKDPDIWGSDALDFRPERWETIRTTWEYIPFLGGARICPAQQMALTEISYLIVRFMKEFKSIENRDEEIDFFEAIKLTMESKNGVKVGFVPA